MQETSKVHRCALVATSSMKDRRTSWPAELQSASQEGLC